jgi:predicted RNase H-like HicB family nuclease
MLKKSYKTIFEPQEEGGYTVTVPSLPGCISEGDTYAGIPQIDFFL